MLKSRENCSPIFFAIFCNITVFLTPQPIDLIAPLTLAQNEYSTGICYLTMILSTFSLR